MSFDVMLRQMTAGFGQTCLIFFMTLIFSLPLGDARIFRKGEQDQADQLDREDLYLDYARNPVDAAASGVVFRTVLSVADEYRRV
mgnify:FL=1